MRRASLLVGFFSVGCVLPHGPLASKSEAPTVAAPALSSPVGSSEAERPLPGPSAQAAPSALPAPATLPPAKVLCGPAISAAPPNGFANDPDLPGPAEEPVGDLDGDGVSEIVVSYPASYQERAIMVIRRAPPPACHEVLYDGVGQGAVMLRSKTKGRRDLVVLLVPITSRGRGSATAVAQFDGRVYRLTRIVSCRDIEGKPLTAKECRSILDSYRPPKAVPDGK